MGSKWYVDWFASEDYLSVYKHRNSEDASKLFNLIIKSVELRKNNKILDAACGAGRHSIAFAKSGYEVTAFDLSKTLLTIAKEEAKKNNLSIEFILSDLRTFCVHKNFDLIVNLFTSFGYFDSDSENFQFPKNAYKMLKNGGYYILDYLNKERLLNSIVPKSEKFIDGRKIIEERSLVNNRVVKKIIIQKEGNEKIFYESVKLYSKDDLIDQFAKIGYSVYKLFGDYLGTPFNNNISERCLIIFQK